MLEPFQLPFVQHGIVEVLILAVAGGLIGTWIVLRGLAFYAHAVGTAAFPGLVLADGLGFAAVLGAGATAALVAVAVGLLARREGARDRYDSLTALVLVAALAVGVILASDVFHSAGSVETLLFGSLLLVDGGDYAFAAVSAAIVRRGRARARAALAGDGLRPGAPRAPSAPARRRPTSRSSRSWPSWPSPRSRRWARCWRPRCSWSRPPPRGWSARACVRGSWPRSRSWPWRAWRGCGCRCRSTRLPGRPSPCSPAGCSRPWPPAGCSARAAPPRAAVAVGRARAARRLRHAAAAPRPPGQAQGRRDHDPDRRLRPRRGRRAGQGRAGPRAQHRPARLRAAPLGRARDGRRRRRAPQRRRARPLDGRRRRGGRRRPGDRRPRRARAGQGRGGELGPEASRYDPHWWHDPRNAAGGRGGDPRRADQGQPRRPRRLRAQRRRLPGPAAEPRPRHRRLHEPRRARGAQARHRPRRLRLLRPALRHHGGRAPSSPRRARRPSRRRATSRG